MSSGFDLIAPVYDRLACLVFGENIFRSQTAFLNHIPGRARVLILGGGTGRIITAVLDAQPDCEIWYVESSPRMMELARTRLEGDGRKSRIHFLAGDHELRPQIYFDVIVTNFFLDVFCEEALMGEVARIKSFCHKDSIWLVSDFVNRALWQRLFLWLMYWFFDFLGAIDRHSLPRWSDVLEKEGFQKAQSRHYYGAFIESALFRAL